MKYWFKVTLKHNNSNLRPLFLFAKNKIEAISAANALTKKLVKIKKIEKVKFYSEKMPFRVIYYYHNIVESMNTCEFGKDIYFQEEVIYANSEMDAWEIAKEHCIKGSWPQEITLYK